MTTIVNATIGDIIKAVADRYQADVLICEACSWIESEFNPNAVGDNGTSFGLYQLHVGGELGDHDEAWAKNPLNNARTAIAEIAAVEHEHPRWSPGAVAAAAQRPAGPVAYMAAVNAVYLEVKAGKAPAGWLINRNRHSVLTITDPDEG